VNVLREAYRSTTCFKRFLSSYCSIGGSTPAQTFAIAFATFCMASGRRPVPEEALVVLLARLGDGFLVQTESGMVVRLGCSYVPEEEDEERFYGKYGMDFYDLG
jgi:hypothetical protein